MPTIVSQTASSSFAESPVTVDVQSTSLLTSSSLKQVCELYVWGGLSSAQPSTPSYTLKKFPLDFSGNKYSVFDFSPILNSFTTSSLGRLIADAGSNTKWFTYEVYEEAKNASGQTITGSHATPTGGPFIVTDGYLKWGEKRDLAGSESLSSIVSSFPLLTSAPISQSIIRTDVPIYMASYARSDGSTPRATNIYVYDDLGNSDSLTLTSGETNSTYTIDQKGIFVNNFVASGSSYVKVVARNSSTPISDVYHFDLDCQKKYTPQRIMWKNRAGGMDQFEFSLVSRTSMNSETQTYQQNALNMYNGQYDAQKGVTTYTTQGNESILVNTDYVTEDYNDFFKDLMVSSEIYLVEPAENAGDLSYYGATWTPLTLESKNMTFKTSVVDKLIQYSFSFRYGTPYKLVL